MMASCYTEVMETFQSMLERSAAFATFLGGVYDENKVFWVATFDEVIEDGVTQRPFAVIQANPFQATRNTEGDMDAPLYVYSLQLYLTKQPDPAGSDQDKLKTFMEEAMNVFDELVYPTINTSALPFIQLTGEVQEDVNRVSLRAREGEDDYFEIQFAFNQVVQ